MYMKCEDSRRVLITGGGRGIGAAVRQRCIAEGYTPIVLDIKNGDIECDLSNQESIAWAMNEALEEGPITRVVNNVGLVAVDRLSDVSYADLLQSFNVNVMSHVLVTKALLPSMTAARFGRIVNVSSRAALGKVGRTSYGSAKAAVHGLTLTWALELGESGITVNTVSPGPIATEMFDAANVVGSAEREAIVSSIPVARMGSPDDVAGAVGFFLGSASGFVTGQNLRVCGGLSL